jgi:hypothetical protein
LKRAIAVLSISLLLAASMLGYAECWIRGSQSCRPKAPACSRCSHETRNSEANQSRVCVGNVQCEPTEEREESSGGCCFSEDSTERKCAPMFCRLFTPLVASGPNKPVSITVFPVESELPATQRPPLRQSRSVVPEALPPWAIPPIIQSTVLRI